MRSRWFAACTLGVESALEAELSGVGAMSVRTVPGGAIFDGDTSVGYAANLWLRSAIRVQENLIDTQVSSPDDYYAAIEAHPWEDLITPRHTLSIDASVADSFTTHSGFAGLKAKDAIVDRVRSRTGDRPSVDRTDPDVPIKVVLKHNRLGVSRNLSGLSLHKRGWRPIQVKSPLNEATAAGILRLGEWDPTTSLLDPMCGSGTFVIEAALRAARRAPGLTRSFAFMRWPDFDEQLWTDLCDDARGRALQTLGIPLLGADRHAGAVSLARLAAEAAGVADLVRFEQADIADFRPPAAPAAVFVNPPYGERLGEGEDLERSWVQLGRFLKNHCGGAQVHILCGDKALSQHLRLRAARRIPVRNGPVDCRVLRYEILAPRQARSDAPPA